MGGNRGADHRGGGAGRRGAGRVPAPRTHSFRGVGLSQREVSQRRGRAAGGERHSGERTHQQGHTGGHPTLPRAHPTEDRKTRWVSLFLFVCNLESFKGQVPDVPGINEMLSPHGCACWCWEAVGVRCCWRECCNIYVPYLHAPTGTSSARGSSQILVRVDVTSSLSRACNNSNLLFAPWSALVELVGWVG